ncbi:MAG: 16S rRNA (guanine(966)-N(2))-methyltransferase RsmD [Bacteroidaceae bacterium]|nr:16S rRNA (guanine(966)-N(2))-methyltransferase RsmD [Bacteroidaceae bacterium]
MRAITGKYKGRHIAVPRTFKARPTTDFAKENLFNVLRSYVDFEGLHVLDLFAGTGSITLEFLSRGATRVVSIEKDFQHSAFIRRMLADLGDTNAVVLKTDALKYLEKVEGDTFSLIFADPPYALPQLGQLPQLVMQSSLLASGGLFVLEHGKDYDFSERPDFLEHRAYGSVNFSLFRH